MKKLLFLILALVSIAFLVGCTGTSRPTDNFCEDSDFGENIYVKGNTVLGDEIKTDYCSTNGMLTEYFCPSSNELSFKNHTCDCAEGACKADIKFANAYYSLNMPILSHSFNIGDNVYLGLVVNLNAPTPIDVNLTMHTFNPDNPSQSINTVFRKIRLNPGRNDYLNNPDCVMDLGIVPKDEIGNLSTLFVIDEEAKYVETTKSDNSVTRNVSYLEPTCGPRVTCDYYFTYFWSNSKQFCRNIDNNWVWVPCANCGSSNWCQTNGYVSYQNYAAGKELKCLEGGQLVVSICNDNNLWKKCSYATDGNKTTANNRAYTCYANIFEPVWA